MLRISAIVLIGLSSASAFAPGAFPTLATQKMGMSTRRAMLASTAPLGLRMEDNSFLKNVPKPKSLQSVGLSDDARQKVWDPTILNHVSP
jgi:hypothetical protein